MAEQNVRASVIVTGDVQGVFYRVWTKSNAKDLSLVGWVKNLADGSVEAVFEGNRKHIDEMINRMRTGSQMANVEDVKINYTEATGEFNQFSIVA